MEIVVVANHFAPHFEGGTESVVRAQARELVALGNRVRVVAGTDRPHAGADVLRAEHAGLEVAFVPRKSDEYYDLELRRPRLRALVAELLRGADLVHVHHWATLHSSLARDVRAAGVPVVLTLHDLFATCPRFFRLPPDPTIACPPRDEREPCARCIAPGTGWSHGRLLAGLEERERWVAAELEAASAIVVPSRAQGARLNELLALDAERLHVVAHGLSDPLPRVVRRGWDGTGRLRILFLGHRSDVKGVGELVRGAAGLSAPERARIQLVLLGDEVVEGFDDSLRAAAGDLELVFAGSYEFRDLPARLEALGGAHLGAFPSRAWESYGLVPDELMALGLPVWVSDRGAPMERVGGAGRVLPAEDARAWTRALAGVLADPEALERERAALPAEGRTAKAAAAELQALYARLLA